ncbi:MAG: hypothetical protein ACRDTE_24870 [Pseudonocardiaceae bacterium]
MAQQEVGEDSAPTEHSVRIDWFQRDPGGGTIFVKPAGDDSRAPQPIAD